MVPEPEFMIRLPLFISCRLSQDLAKDLAILAREIHDVTGDGEPPNISPAVSAEVAQEKVWNWALLRNTSNPTT